MLLLEEAGARADDGQYRQCADTCRGHAHGDMYQLDKVANETHNGEAHCNGLGNLDELCTAQTDTRATNMSASGSFEQQ